jgi:hypothetical protein
MENNMSTALQQQLPGIPEPANILDIVSRAASDPNIDVSKTEKLLEMYERIAARNAEVAFNTSMRAAQEEMPKILRNKENQQTNSRYADLEKVNAAIVPVYTKHGFSLSFGTADCPIPGHYRVTCLVSHVAGHSRAYQADVPADLTGMKGNQNKTPTHGFGSTMSYGRRYLTLLVFNVTLTNEDQDGNQGGETLTEEQIANIEALLTETASDKARFLRFIKVEALDQIPAKNYSSIVKMIEAKRARS